MTIVRRTVDVERDFPVAQSCTRVPPVSDQCISYRHQILATGVCRKRPGHVEDVFDVLEKKLSVSSILQRRCRVQERFGSVRTLRC